MLGINLGILLLFLGFRISKVLTLRNSGFRCSPFGKSSFFKFSSRPIDLAVIRTALTGGLGSVWYKMGAIVDFARWILHYFSQLIFLNIYNRFLITDK